MPRKLLMREDYRQLPGSGVQFIQDGLLYPHLEQLQPVSISTLSSVLWYMTATFWMQNTETPRRAALSFTNQENSERLSHSLSKRFTSSLIKFLNQCVSLITLISYSFKNVYNFDVYLFSMVEECSRRKSMDVECKSFTPKKNKTM